MKKKILIHQKKQSFFKDLTLYLGLLLLSLVLLSTVSACSSKTNPEPDCGSTQATVQKSDCGWLLILADGKRLVPVANMGFCGTGLTEEDIQKATFAGNTVKVGMLVKIGYQFITQEGCEDVYANCGRPVKITCLTKIPAFEK
ncbi:MAG: hypothetical protein H7Y04_06980 [Verrucomicrobia bacterium]|nr:hypothetical protein [Cytophagales bacterium]